MIVKIDHTTASGIRRTHPTSAFTLLEVMVAVMIFFMCMFSILALVSGSLSYVRSFQQTTVTASSVAAELSLTNALVEGVAQGDFGKLYPDYRWESETMQAGSNGLFNVHFTVFRAGNSKPESELSVLMFRPQSRTGIGR